MVSALQGQSVEPQTLRAVAELLRICIADTELMEQRLVGIQKFHEGSNVVSLRPYLLKKRYVIRRVVEEDRPL